MTVSAAGRAQLQSERRRVGQKVQHRAVRVDMGLEAIEILRRSRARQSDGPADALESGPDRVVHGKEAAQIDVTLQ